MFHRPGKSSKGEHSFLIIAALLCLGATAAAPVPPNESAQTTQKVRETLQLQPIQVVYRHVEGTPWKGPMGVFVDRTRGEVYVADTMNDLVTVCDENGFPLFAFGFNGEIKEPIKAVTDARGRIYVLAGIPRKVKVFNYRGEYQFDFPFSGFDVEPTPTAITADVQGNLYVADSASGEILVYDPDHRLRKRIGKGEDERGRFRSVRAITVDQAGQIYVADAMATPLQVFSPQGEFVRGWGEHATGPQNFSLPAGVAVDAEGRVIAVDSLRQAILVFTNEGRFVGRFGGLGTRPGAVAYPSDVASDGNGRIYVVEKVGGRLQILQERLVDLSRVRRDRRAPERVREEIRRSLGEMMNN